MTENNIPPPNDRRSNVDIVADILRVLRLGHAGKIEIVNVAHVSSEQGSKYLEKLLSSGLVEDAGERMGLPAVKITPKGLSVLGMIENLKEMLPSDGVIELLKKTRISGINVGKIFATRKLAQLARENKKFASFVQNSLDQYRKGEWGESGPREKRINDLSEKTGRRIFSCYESPDKQEICITTTPDREYTTIMFPDEP